MQDGRGFATCYNKRVACTGFRRLIVLAGGVMDHTHRSSGLVVVQVHGTPQVSLSLVHVDEISREPVAEQAVVAAAAPLPITAA